MSPSLHEGMKEGKKRREVNDWWKVRKNQNIPEKMGNLNNDIESV